MSVLGGNRAPRGDSHCANLRSFEAPITAATMRVWGHVLAAEITVSGSIPSGETTRNVTYFVVDKARNAVVGNITLPDASNFANSFNLNVKVPQLSDQFDVGTMSDDGTFVSAGFKVETPETPTGAVGQDWSR